MIKCNFYKIIYLLYLTYFVETYVCRDVHRSVDRVELLTVLVCWLLARLRVVGYEGDLVKQVLQKLTTIQKEKKIISV